MRTEHAMRTIASGKCELDIDGTLHECRLDSISSTGARLNCLGFLRETRKGDKTVLRLEAEANEIDCRVTRIAAGKIQLRFVG
jgi:PilZ domain-containing protein